MSSIPANVIVSVTPSVLSAGGTGLQLSGLLLSNNTRTPIGSILAFGSAAAVSAYYGPGSTEYTNSLNYFAGFNGSTIKPANLWVTQYNQVAVPAYLRGASTASLTLAQLQALSGTIIVSVEGVTKTSSSINLSSATSPSSAAALVQAGFTGANLYDAITASTTTIAAGTATNSTNASISGYTLTVAASVTGAFVIGGVLSGTGVTSGTTITGFGTGTGGVGTYTVSVAQDVATTTITQTYGLMTVATMASGTFYVGQVISGGTTAAGSTITAFGTGTGGIGTYIISGGSQSVSATTISAGPLAVSYDSVSGGYVITSGAPGAVGTIGYASGTLAAGLKLTAVTGAVTSQGADAATPAAFMSAVINQNTNWATFMTNFDPDNGVGNANKLLFAHWNGLQNNQYEYVAWDTDVTPTLSTNAASSLGQILKQDQTSGTVCIYDPLNVGLAAFKCGLTASIDFTQTNGRATSAFKSQSGMPTTVTTLTAYNNLLANLYNSYGTFATRAQNFQFYSNGSVSGPFEWDDSYVNQIWLNSGLQLALIEMLTQLRSIPYNSSGYAQVRAACLPVITAGVNNGVISPGVPLSQAQASEVNTSAGMAIDTTLSSTGWYLQILPAAAITRGNRASPPMTLWYMDGGSIQQINLSSIEVQ